MKNLFDRIFGIWLNLTLGIRLVLIFVGLCALAILLWRPVVSAIKAVALERNSRLAEAALAAGDAQEARSRSLAAIQSDPERIRVTRTALQAMDLLNDPKRIQVAMILMRHPDASPNDRRLALRVLASHGPMGWVGAAWAALPKEEKAGPEMIDALARRLIVEGKAGEAALLLKDVDFANLPDLSCRLVIDLLQNQGSGEAWRESRTLLFKRTRMAVDAGEPIPDWCLDAWERLPQEHLEPEFLTAFPEGGPRRIQMFRRRIEQGGQILDPGDPVVAVWLRECQPEDRLSLASLLSSCGCESGALDLLEKAADLTQKEYEWIRSLRIHKQAWRPWLDFLQSSAVLGISKAWVDADRALAYLQLDEKSQSKNAWRGAMEWATLSAQSSRLVDLSHRVRPWMPAEAGQALLAAVGSGDQALPLFNDLQWLARSLKDARNDKALLDLCRAYLRIEPGNPVLVTRYAYLALLTGELSPAAAVRMVAPVVESQPKSAHPRIVGVIAALLREDAPEALRLAARDSVSWKDSPPFYQWLIARAEDPGSSLAPPDEATLLPVEYSLVQKLR